MKKFIGLLSIVLMLFVVGITQPAKCSNPVVYGLEQSVSALAMPAVSMVLPSVNMQHIGCYVFKNSCNKITEGITSSEFIRKTLSFAAMPFKWLGYGTLGITCSSVSNADSKGPLLKSELLNIIADSATRTQLLKLLQENKPPQSGSNKMTWLLYILGLLTTIGAIVSKIPLVKSFWWLQIPQVLLRFLKDHILTPPNKAPNGEVHSV